MNTLVILVNITN